VTDNGKTYTLKEAAAYVLDKLPPNRKKWANPARTLKSHVDAGQLRPIGGRKPNHALQFTESELDRFLSDEYNPTRSIDLSPVVARMGQVPDRILAAEIGCNITTIWRHRKQLGIPGYRNKRHWGEDGRSGGTESSQAGPKTADEGQEQ